jgi:hypothetical protein
MSSATDRQHPAAGRARGLPINWLKRSGNQCDPLRACRSPGPPDPARAGHPPGLAASTRSSARPLRERPGRPSRRPLRPLVPRQHRERDSRTQCAALTGSGQHQLWRGSHRRHGLRAGPARNLGHLRPRLRHRSEATKKPARAALAGSQGNGPATIAVLAGGLDQDYTSGNADLAAAIRANGLTLSELPQERHLQGPDSCRGNALSQPLQGLPAWSKPVGGPAR